MKIFNVEIFGEDAKWFVKLTKCKQKEWILKRTNQTNDAIIEEFLNSKMIDSKCVCVNCGKDGNISKTNAIEVEPSSGNILSKEQSQGNSIKRQRTTKRAKN